MTLGACGDSTPLGSTDTPAVEPPPHSTTTDEPAAPSPTPDDPEQTTEPSPELPGCTEADGPIYALTPEPYTTLQQLWKPKAPSTGTRAKIATSLLQVDEISDFADNGLGVELEGGRPWVEHRDGVPLFEEGDPGHRKSVAYFWQAADPQMIDEESPTRFEPFKQLYRPQGHLIPQIFNAQVQTVRRLSELSTRPLEFAILAGDLSDGSQRNELNWVIKILNGGLINPDSGEDNDPVPGEGNDYNDPFCAPGFSIPWYAALGNHETLYNGGFGEVSDELREASIGSQVYNGSIFPNGYRDGSTLLGDVINGGSTPADSNRLILRLREVLQLFLDAPGLPSGHGLTQDNVDEGMGYFSVYPLSGKPIRLITLKTVDSDALMGVGHQGHMDEIQFQWLQNELADAASHNELILVASHHGADEMGFTSPISGSDIKNALLATPGVVLHLTGHGHHNTKHYVSGSQGGYWELMLTSTLDFPMQTRLIEIVNESNGYASIYLTNIDHNSPEESLAHEGRRLAASKLAFMELIRGKVDDFWAEDTQAQNLLLRVKIPESVNVNLSEYEWSSTVESVETLQSLSD